MNYRASEVSVSLALWSYRKILSIDVNSEYLVNEPFGQVLWKIKNLYSIICLISTNLFFDKIIINVFKTSGTVKSQLYFPYTKAYFVPIL